MKALSSFISKVKQGGGERATKTVQTARRGVSEAANAGSLKKWKWKNRNKASAAGDVMMHAILF